MTSVFGEGGASRAQINRRLSSYTPVSVPRVCALGDSITAAGATIVGSTYSLPAFGFTAWLPAVMGQRINIEIADNFGVAGDTTQLMLARLPSVIARNPAWCTVLAGTNDAVAIAAATATYAATIANLTTIYTTLMNAGIGVIAIPVLNRSGISATTQRIIGRINSWILSYAKTAGPGFCVADPRSVWTDSTGLPPVANSYDGTHPTGLGAFLLAQNISAKINNLMPPYDLRFLDPADVWNASDNPTGNLLTNGEMAGTGGSNTAANITGSVPTSWALSRFPTTAFTGTTTVAKAARTDGVPGEWTVLTFTGTGGAFGSCAINLRQTLTVDDVTISAGDVLDCFCDIEFTNTSGLLSAQFNIAENDGATNIFYNAVSGPAIGAASLSFPASSGTLLCKAPRFTVRPSGGGARSVQVNLQVSINTNAGTTAVVKFGGAQVRKVI